MIAKLNQGVVIVPWDFSRLSRAGLDHALHMTNDLKRIHVVHVANPLSGPDNGVLHAAAEKGKYRELGSRFRDQIADASELDGVSFDVVYGHLGLEIARFADRYKADCCAQRSGSGPAALAPTARNISYRIQVKHSEQRWNEQHDSSSK